MVKVRKKRSVKYDFSNPESQKLFEEFSILLTDITKYLEEREKRIKFLEEALEEREKRIKFLEEALKEREQEIAITEAQILYLENELTKSTRIRYMLKELVKKFFSLFYRIVSYLPKKILTLFAKLRNKFKL